MSHLCVNTLPATTLAFLALLGAPYIYDISSLRVKLSRLRKETVVHNALRQRHIHGDIWT